MATVREGVVPTVTGKPLMANYPVGACITLNLPDAQLVSFKGVVVKRSTNFATGEISLTVRSETDAKHAWALGQSNSDPATPQIGGRRRGVDRRTRLGCVDGDRRDEFERRGFPAGHQRGGNRR